MGDADISGLLIELRNGNRSALDRLFPLVYEALLGIAHRRRTAARDATLSTGDLVHEAYIRLADQARLEFNDRRHFFAVAAMAMRQIVVDRARRRAALKRGGNRRRLSLDQVELAVDAPADEVLLIDEALGRLSKLDERLGRVVELRFFGGLPEDAVAEVLGVDPRTVRRDWRKARAILFHELGGNEV